MQRNNQDTPFDEETDQQSGPAAAWDTDATKRALDELFTLTHQYKSSQAYYDLLHFIARFPAYAPFNAMLVHVQMPGARYVLTPLKWLNNYGRVIKPGARPLVILKTMGPVMFVFDVSETDGNYLPQEIECPFETRNGKIGDKLPRTICNSKRDGVFVYTAILGSQRGGSIQTVIASKKTVVFDGGECPLRYQIELAQNVSDESRYTSLVHELAHLYCGHLGTPNSKWWPDRRGLPYDTREFEAESVAYMVSKRFGLDCPSEQYLAGYVKSGGDVPAISLECVMKAAGLIESMGKQDLKPRKTK